MKGVMAAHGPSFRPQPAQAPGGVTVRILVLGATGYVGSRVVPALLEAGHEVVAASSSLPDPDRFAWGDAGRVGALRRHRRDGRRARRVEDVDGRLLPGALAQRRAGSTTATARGADVVRDAVRRAAAYDASCISPDWSRTSPPTSCREHISSRLEVERGARRGRQRDVLGAVAACRRGHRRRVDVVRGDPPAVHAAAGAARAELAASTGCSRSPSATCCARWWRPSPDDHLTGAVDIGGPNVAALLPAARRVRARRRPAARAGAHAAGARRRWSASAPPPCVPLRSGPSPR